MLSSSDAVAVTDGCKADRTLHHSNLCSILLCTLAGAVLGTALMPQNRASLLYQFDQIIRVTCSDAAVQTNGCKADSTSTADL